MLPMPAKFADLSNFGLIFNPDADEL